MMSTESVQNHSVKLVTASLAKWHQTLVEALHVSWAGPLTVGLKRATNDLATVIAPVFGRASPDPYKAVCKRLSELHSKGAGFPSEEEANDVRELVRQCGIATAAFGVFTGQDRAVKHLEDRLKQTDKQQSPTIPKPRGGRVRDEDKRRCINEAMDKEIYDGKKIQPYVAKQLGISGEKVSRKMISEVRRARQAKGLPTKRALATK